MSEAPVDATAEPAWVDPLPPYEPRDRVVEERDARSLLDDCKERSAAHAKHYHDIAVVNESFALGDQWWARDYSRDQSRFLDDQWFKDEELPRIYVNKVGNLNITLAALLTRNRPTVKAVAASSEPEDLFRAAMAQKVIENLQTKLKTAGKVHQSAIYAGQHGMAGWKVVYSPDTDSVEAETLTIFNVFLDPTCEDYHKSDYCIFRDYRAPSWAREQIQKLARALDDRSLETLEPVTEDYKTADGITLEGVECLELWHKPTERYPRGLYAFFCAGVMLEFIPEFPNTFYGDGATRPTFLFPAVLFKMRTIRGNLYGHTNFSDCINLQRALNEVNSRIIELVRRASHVVMILPKEQEGTFKPGKDAELYVPLAQSAQMGALGFMKTFQIPAELFGERAYYEAKIADVMGLNQITSGSETRSISGRAIENIVEIDAQKNSDATKSLEDGEQDFWTLALRLVQRNYKTSRTIKITDGDDVDVLSFRGADIDGVDVRLEPASERDSTEDAKQADADERAAQGLPPLEATQGASASANMAASFAEHVLSKFLTEGRTPDLQPDDTDWGVFLDVVQKYKSRAIAKNRPEDFAALVQLEGQIRAFLQSRAAEQVQAKRPAPAVEPAPGPEASPAPQPAAPAPPGGMVQ